MRFSQGAFYELYIGSASHNVSYWLMSASIYSQGSSFYNLDWHPKLRHKLGPPTRWQVSPFCQVNPISVLLWFRWPGACFFMCKAKAHHDIGTCPRGYSTPKRARLQWHVLPMTRFAPKFQAQNIVCKTWLVKSWSLPMIFTHVFTHELLSISYML